MSDDPYALLGVARDATPAQLKAAYRKLHPDVNPGDRTAEDRFKRVSAAHDLLSDPEKRARFDRGEIDASGAERAPPRRQQSGAGGARFEDIFDGEDLLAELFGRGAGGRPGGQAGTRLRGGDVEGRLALDFLDAVNGATKRLRLPDGSMVEVKVPPGTQDGQVLRLRGKGGAGLGGGPAGDLLVTVEVGGHHRFTRHGDDIHLDLDVSLPEAVLGGRVEVPTPAGAVMLAVPAGSNSGTVLRLKGRGVPRADGSRGDAFATLRVVLPEGRDAELEAFLRGWKAGRAHDPRRGG